MHQINHDCQPEAVEGTQFLLLGSTGNLVIDPRKTKRRDNAVRVEGNQLVVMITIPQLPDLSEAKLIDFATRTFRLTSSVTLSKSNANKLQKSSLEAGREFPCIEIKFSIYDPQNYQITLSKVKDCKIINLEDFEAKKTKESEVLENALKVFTSQLDAKALEGYGLKKLVGFEKQFGLLHSHAYALVHDFLSKNKITHFYHSTEDNYHNYRLGTGNSDTAHLEKAFAGSPLTNLACFLNILQLRKAITSKKELFIDSDLKGLVQVINRLRDNQHSPNRKEVISRAVSRLRPGARVTQSIAFRRRKLIMTDHLSHSAPIVKDAWQLLLSPAIEIPIKSQILAHAIRNPAYAYSLLSELNGSSAFHRQKFKIKEDFDLESRTARISIQQKDLTSRSVKKTSLKTVFENYFKDRDCLRIQAIQTIAGFKQETQTNESPKIPNNLLTNYEKDRLAQYLDQDLKVLLKQAGYEMTYQEKTLGAYSYLQIIFTDSNNKSFSYETAPLFSNARTTPSLMLSEAVNFVMDKLEALDITPANDFQPSINLEQKELEDRLRVAGITKLLLKSRASVHKKIPMLYLEYDLQLVGDSKTSRYQSGAKRLVPPNLVKKFVAASTSSQQNFINIQSEKQIPFFLDELVNNFNI